VADSNAGTRGGQIALCLIRHMLRQHPLQLFSRQPDGLVISGELKTKAIVVNRDSQAGRTWRHAVHVTQLLLTEFVVPAT
jgi:hypothetical protein